MSILARIDAEFSKEKLLHNDDLDMRPLLDALSPDELRTWTKEAELCESLYPEFGGRPDFYDIVEREIYARGIETA